MHRKQTRTRPAVVLFYLFDSLETIDLQAVPALIDYSSFLA